MNQIENQNENQFAKETWAEEAARVRKLLETIWPKDTPAAYVHSFGCQQNTSDGERLKGYLVACGYRLCDSAQGADLVLFNTCAVREHAEDRVFGNLGALKHEKEKNPRMIIGVCGCMTEQDKVAQKIYTSFPHVDFVFGSGDGQRLPGLLRRRLEGSKRLIENHPQSRTITEDQPVIRESGFKAYVPVMYGCDNFCSYCIVPYVRGRERSRQKSEIVKEVRQLIFDGYREITLLGQNVNSYGKGLAEQVDFSDLLQELDALKGDFRLRFMTSHPKDASEKLLQTMADSRHICHALHLPVQSGNDRVLSAMNRRYTAEHYMELTAKAKQLMPDITLSSDIIVGFPGETEAEFEDTYRMVEQVGYAQLFTFIYSRRTGTKAATMPDPVPHEEKTRWLSRLLTLQSGKSEQLHKSLIGTKVRVLADGIGKTADGWLSGRTPGNLICEFPGKPEQIGSFVSVLVESATNWCVTGRVAE